MPDEPVSQRKFLRCTNHNYVAVDDITRIFWVSPDVQIYTNYQTFIVSPLLTEDDFIAWRDKFFVTVDNEVNSPGEP